MRLAKKQTYTRYTRMNEKKIPVNCTNNWTDLFSPQKVKRFERNVNSLVVV